jgi:hypothetical protein
MVPEDYDSDPELDKTLPPLMNTRYNAPATLYADMPQVSRLTQHRPREAEDHVSFLLRLRGSTTPEEAVTFTAFAVVPKMAIWWGYECLRLAGDDITQDERRMMELVAQWTQYPGDENRFQAMQMGLFARVRSPAQSLCLAVGWSGGPIAPNDPAPVAAHRTPRAISTAVLGSLAKADLTQRPVRLARFINEAAQLFGRR